MPTPNHNWTALAQSIQKGRTILVLGPGAVTMARDKQRVSLQTLLSEHLVATLQHRDPAVTLIANPSLPYLAKTLEDTIFVQERQKKSSFSEENARAEVYTCIADFYA